MIAAHPAPATTAARPRLLRPDDVVELQAVRGYPCASLLMTTTPGPRLAAEDADRLALLLADAARRLAREPDRAAAAQVQRRLDRLAGDVAAGPTAQAIGLFAAPTVARCVYLPVAVADRVVIDPTFATRDLVRSLQRRPPHLVLLLGRTARLLADDGQALVEIRVGGLPVRIRGSMRERLRRVDAALDAALGNRVLPVVVLGDQRHVTTFLRCSRHQRSLFGAVGSGLAWEPDATPALLAEQVRPLLDGLLADRERAAVDLLARRARHGRAVSGLGNAWAAAVAGTVDLLVVEESFAVAARLSPDGQDLWPAGDPEAPDVLDDVVDELIEAVLERGGWVAVVADGTLAERGGVAATLRGGVGPGEGQP